MGRRIVIELISRFDIYHTSHSIYEQQIKMKSENAFGFLGLTTKFLLYIYIYIFIIYYKYIYIYIYI